MPRDMNVKVFDTVNTGLLMLLTLIWSLLPLDKGLYSLVVIGYYGHFHVVGCFRSGGNVSKDSMRHTNIIRIVHDVQNRKVQSTIKGLLDSFVLLCFVQE